MLSEAELKKEEAIANHVFVVGMARLKQEYDKNVEVKPVGVDEVNNVLLCRYGKKANLLTKNSASFNLLSENTAIAKKLEGSKELIFLAFNSMIMQTLIKSELPYFELSMWCDMAGETGDLSVFFWTDWIYSLLEAKLLTPQASHCLYPMLMNNKAEQEVKTTIELELDRKHCFTYDRYELELFKSALAQYFYSEVRKIGTFFGQSPQSLINFLRKYYSDLFVDCFAYNNPSQNNNGASPIKGVTQSKTAINKLFGNFEWGKPISLDDLLVDTPSLNKSLAFVFAWSESKEPAFVPYLHRNPYKIVYRKGII